MAQHELRPLSGGEILDGAFAVYREYLPTFLGIAVIGYGLGTVLSTYVTIAGGVVMHPVLALLGLAANAIGGLLAAGASVWVISEAYLGRAPSLGPALRYAGTRMGTLFVAGLAKYLLVFIGLFLLIAPGIVLACGYAVVAQVAVLEQSRTPIEALGRSWNLTKGYKPKAAGLGLVVFFVVYIPAILGGILATLFASMAHWFIAASSVLSVVVYPLIGCTFTLFYYDLRVRREAFDLEVLSRQLAGTSHEG